MSKNKKNVAVAANEQQKVSAPASPGTTFFCLILIGLKAVKGELLSLVAKKDSRYFCSKASSGDGKGGTKTDSAGEDNSKNGKDNATQEANKKMELLEQAGEKNEEYLKKKPRSGDGKGDQKKNSAGKDHAKNGKDNAKKGKDNAKNGGDGKTPNKRCVEQPSVRIVPYKKTERKRGSPEGGDGQEVIVGLRLLAIVVFLVALHKLIVFVFSSPILLLIFVFGGFMSGVIFW